MTETDIFATLVDFLFTEDKEKGSRAMTLFILEGGERCNVTTFPDDYVPLAVKAEREAAVTLILGPVDWGE